MQRWPHSTEAEEGRLLRRKTLAQLPESRRAKEEKKRWKHPAHAVSRVVHKALHPLTQHSCPTCHSAASAGGAIQATVAQPGVHNQSVPHSKLPSPSNSTETHPRPLPLSVPLSSPPPCLHYQDAGATAAHAVRMANRRRADGGPGAIMLPCFFDASMGGCLLGPYSFWDSPSEHLVPGVGGLAADAAQLWASVRPAPVRPATLPRTHTIEPVQSPPPVLARR